VGGVATVGIFKRVVIEPAYKAVSAAIERAIVDGALLPGTALPTEQALCERFGVHRSTVREPISLLYNTALLQIFERLPQGCERNVTAHRNILDALQRRDGDTAAQWIHKHMVDFQRGFALAGLDMSTALVKSK